MPSNLTSNMSKPHHGAEIVNPAALGAVYMEWLVHLAVLPGTQMYLAVEAAREWARCIEPLRQDQQFADHAWQLALSPGKQIYLAREAVRKWARLLAHTSSFGRSEILP
jgi:hypothetical protein